MNSTIDSNTATGYNFEGGGGGIYGSGAIVNSVIAGNTSASSGGGILAAGAMTVVNSTIAGNSSTSNLNAVGGGGIFLAAGTMTVVNCTIAENTVVGSDEGGGILIYYGSLTLDNTLIALNTSGAGTPDDIDVSPGGTVSSSSAYNLIGTGGSGGLVNGVNGNQVGVANPGLDPNGLQNNGGPTQTIALVAGSPAINAGSNALAIDPTTGKRLTTDQRGKGFPRIVGGTVDIGAYEYQG